MRPLARLRELRGGAMTEIVVVGGVFAMIAYGILTDLWPGEEKERGEE